MGLYETYTQQKTSVCSVCFLFFSRFFLLHILTFIHIPHTWIIWIWMNVYISFFPSRTPFFSIKLLMKMRKKRKWFPLNCKRYKCGIHMPGKHELCWCEVIYDTPLLFLDCFTCEILLWKYIACVYIILNQTSNLVIPQ